MSCLFRVVSGWAKKYLTLCRRVSPLGAFLTFALIVGSAPLWAAVTVTPRHLIILRPGLDTVYGSYIFAVHNETEKSERLKARVMLPKETSDFVPQEGLEPTEISLAPDGGVNVEKDIPKGVHVLGVGFKVDGRYGKTKMSLTPEVEIRSLTILVPRDTSVDLSAAGLKLATGPDSDDPQYRAFVNGDPLPAGAPFVVEVSGLPEGRARLWLTGGVIAACMVLGAALLAFRTRPTIKENQTGETVLVG